jgi:hypothetical protein
MNKKIVSWLLPGAGLLALALLLGNGPQRNVQEFSDQEESARLRRVAGETLRVPLESAEFRSEANLIGFRSKEILFSRRTDSRTYFVQDLRPATEPEKQVYRGSDAEFLGRLREIFKGFEIPGDEIVQAKVLQEQTQEGRLDHDTGKMILEERRPGKRWAAASRRVEGLPVFSSRALLGLGADGRIDFLELHWPAIPAETLAEAHRLEFKVRQSWRPPALEAAHVESAEAGILHSPAIGFVMDFHPAIRVIYAPDEKRYGKKAVRYLDRDGRDVPIPRQFAPPPDEFHGTQRPLREPRKE